MSETFEQMKERLILLEAARENAPTPAEIAERAAAIRAKYREPGYTPKSEPREPFVKTVHSSTPLDRRRAD